jgi:GrpB-like predicted nucleotidyltransferase (UPF0157 family)
MSRRLNSQSGIEIFEYDQKWEEWFILLKEVLEATLGNLIISVEHVGSTSVKGLAAKPILDIDIVIEDNSLIPVVTEGLEKIGYDHQPHWSFKGRESFGRKDTFVPWNKRNLNWVEHHLYVCEKDSEELARHLAFRDYLRHHPDSVAEYTRLKNELARTATDRKAYTDGKTEYVREILERVKKSN